MGEPILKSTSNGSEVWTYVASDDPKVRELVKNVYLRKKAPVVAVVKRIRERRGGGKPPLVTNLAFDQTGRVLTISETQLED